MIDWLALLTAISMVESNLDPKAVNVKEQAYGLYQMRSRALRDANEVAGTQFKARDLGDPRVATAMLRAYCFRYLGNEPQLTDVVDLWNSGPNTMKAGTDYKERVMNLYEELTTKEPTK